MVGIPRSRSPSGCSRPAAGGTGLNDWHLIFYGSTTQLARVLPVVTVRLDPGVPERLRQIKIASGHFTELVVLRPGRWQVHVRTRFGPASVSFVVVTTVAP